MSHDEHAKALGRWLDQPPGSAPPDDLDPQVVQAIYALKPELAPAPRVTADDILASITRGPLAERNAETPAGAGPRQVAEVVPFPGGPAPADTEDSEPTAAAPRRGRLGWWIGGSSGVGLALVAAATLLLVAYPTLQSGRMYPDLAPATAPDRASTASSLSRPAGDAAAASAPEPAEEAEDAEPAPRPPPAPSAARRTASADAREQVYEMDEGSVVGSRPSTLIPELAEALEDEEAADDAVAAADASDPRDETDGDVDLAGARARAVPTDRSSTGWRDGVDGDTLGRLDQTLATAEAQRASGDRRGAADTLSAAVQPPARAGQHLAGLAAADYLAIGDPSAAAGVAQRGLGLSMQGAPERSWLLVLYGDALAALGETRRAVDAYEQSASQNLAR